MENHYKFGIKKENYYLKAFLMGLALAFLMFIPYIIRDGGRFIFYGDFNAQQIPFYILSHDAIKSGNFGWSSTTDLGANFIGSYSFYLVGSPFFWLTLPFPTSWIQFLMGSLLILKFGCASLTSYTFLQRYVKNKDYALLGAVLYTFSGFSIYNIFFNHFHEALVFFPLMLATLDEYIATQKRGMFALSVFACCFVNYYFFAGQVVFCLFYFFVRLIMRSYKISVKNFLFLAFEAVVGVGMTCVLLLPSVLAVIQNDRVDNMINGWDAVVYNNTQRYVHILQSFFFPPDLPARPNFTPDSGSKWASVAAWLPVFGMTGVVAWLNQSKKHWLKTIILISIIATGIPFLNSTFQLFNATFYARWFYMLTLMTTLATIMSLESTKVNWKKSIKYCLIVTLAITAIIGFMPKIETVDEVEKLIFGLEEYPTRFWSYVAIVLIGFAVLIWIFRYVKKEKRAKVCLTLVAIVSVMYGSFFVALGKTQSADPYTSLIPYSLNQGKDLPDLEFSNVRSDFYESNDNVAMYWGIPTIQAFHSIVPGSIMKYYDYIGIDRSVSSHPKTEDYAVRGLTSVRWLFDDENDDEHFAGENFDTPEMSGYSYYGNANGYDIWENQNYIPMGFSYDYFVKESTIEKFSDERKQLIMLKAAVIPDDDAFIWQNVMHELDLDTVSYTEEEYFMDCIDRRSSAATSFEYTKNGFEAIVNNDYSSIMFFSVPYEDGWSASINQTDLRILKTNIGFMSVIVPAGENVKIKFSYKTPGVNFGAIITVISVFLLLVYIYLFRTIKKKKTNGKIAFSKRRTCKMFSVYASEQKCTFYRRTRKGYMRIK